MSKGVSVVLAIAAAALYALSAPLSKILLVGIAPTMLAGLLYLGAGILMSVLLVFGVGKSAEGEGTLTQEDLPYVVAMVLLDVAAPILLLAGLSRAPAANVSLLNNFEIVATAVIAFIVFREPVCFRLWAGIAAIVASCLLLSVFEEGALSFSLGSVLVLAACMCWGVENNCTSSLSRRDARQVVAVKGLCSGATSVAIALCLGEELPSFATASAALVLGSVAYGMSILCYVLAQRGIGAARTSAYYAIAPFVGVALSWGLFGAEVTPVFAAALMLMLLGTWLSLPEADA